MREVIFQTVLDKRSKVLITQLKTMVKTYIGKRISEGASRPEIMDDPLVQLLNEKIVEIYRFSATPTMIIREII